KLFQQFARGQEGTEFQAGVEEVILIGHAVRRSLQESGDFRDRAASEPVQGLDRAVQIVFPVANVRAKGNVCRVPATLDLHAHSLKRELYRSPGLFDLKADFFKPFGVEE